MGFVGYTTINYVIGENYKDVFNVKLPTSSTNCICTFFIHRHVPFLRYKYGRYRSKLLLNEILNVKNDFRESEIECFKDYKALDMMLTFYGSKDGITYVVSLNENALRENSSFHGYDYHSFNNQEDLWKFLADVRSKEESFNQKNPPKEIKCAQDLLESPMKILFEKDVLMKDLAPPFLNIPTYHIDKKSIKISQMYAPRAWSNCSLEM